MVRIQAGVCTRGRGEESPEPVGERKLAVLWKKRVLGNDSPAPRPGSPRGRASARAPSPRQGQPPWAPQREYCSHLPGFMGPQLQARSLLCHGIKFFQMRVNADKR